MHIESFDIQKRKSPPGASIADDNKDFELMFSGKTNIEHFLEKFLTVYSVNIYKNYVAFVETNSYSDLLSQPFFYKAQFEHASKVYRVPIDVLHEAAKKISLPNCNSIFVFSVGRCGSTLLTEMLKNTSSVLSLSEPDVFTKIAALYRKKIITEEESKELLRSIWILLTTDRSTYKSLVVKMRSEATLICKLMMEAIPESSSIFMYRNAESVIESYNRIWGYPYTKSRWLFRAPGVSFIYRNWRYMLHKRNPQFLDVYTRVFGKECSIDVLSRMGLCGRFMLDWLVKVNCYFELRKIRPDTVALRYEDLVQSPEKIISQLFDFMFISKEEISSAYKALDKDSQAGTKLARTSKHKECLDQKDKKAIRKFFEEKTSIGSPEAVLPGTI